MRRRAIFSFAGALAARGETGGGRLAQAAQVRLESVNRMREEKEAEQESNGDERRYWNRVGSYTKGLPHDREGQPNGGVYEQYVEALETRTKEAMERVPMGGRARFANPLGAVSFDFVGLDACQFGLPGAPALASAEHAADMAEVYWRALARDVPFTAFGTNSITREASARLRELRGYQGPDPVAHLFRGSFAGDKTGPYVSQFLWRPIPFGSSEIGQKWRTLQAGIDYQRTQPEWLAAENGSGAAEAAVWAAEARYIVTPRDLATYVWKDFSFQAYLNAALILLGDGEAVMRGDHPYGETRSQAGFVNYGGPMVLDFVARVANAALRAAWFQKWQVHRRLRPEECGGRRELLRGIVHRDLEGMEMGILPMAYPEGCPLHPAYPAGHATIAGACTTVLKALFNPEAEVPKAVVPDDEGRRLERWEGGALTVGGELDKLASNLSYGRDFAGVHYRSDGYWGLRLGERVATAMLRELVTGLPEG